MLASLSGFEFDFTYFLWTFWASSSLKTITGECCWERLVCCIICFMVPFTNGNNKSLSISSGKIWEYGHSSPLAVHKLRFFMSFVLYHNIVSIIVTIYNHSLQTYQHASGVIQSLVEEDINVKFLVQLDKLIRLLETPIFAYLRLQVPYFLLLKNIYFFFLKFRAFGG